MLRSVILCVFLGTCCTLLALESPAESGQCDKEYDTCVTVCEQDTANKEPEVCYAMCDDKFNECTSDTGEPQEL